MSILVPIVWIHLLGVCVCVCVKNKPTTEFEVLQKGASPDQLPFGFQRLPPIQFVWTVCSLLDRAGKKYLIYGVATIWMTTSFQSFFGGIEWFNVWGEESIVFTQQQLWRRLTMTTTDQTLMVRFVRLKIFICFVCTSWKWWSLMKNKTQLPGENSIKRHGWNWAIYQDRIFTDQ